MFNIIITKIYSKMMYLKLQLHLTGMKSFKVIIGNIELFSFLEISYQFHINYLLFISVILEGCDKWYYLNFLASKLPVGRPSTALTPNSGSWLMGRLTVVNVTKWIDLSDQGRPGWSRDRGRRGETTNRGCHPGGHYLYYKPGTLSCRQATSSYLKIRHP